MYFLDLGWKAANKKTSLQGLDKRISILWSDAQSATRSVFTFKSKHMWLFSLSLTNNHFSLKTEIDCWQAVNRTVSVRIYKCTNKLYS